MPASYVRHATTARIFLPRGEPIKAGEIFRNPDFAATLGKLVDAERQANSLNGLFPDRLGNQAAAAQDGTVWVFALRDRIESP